METLRSVVQLVVALGIYNVWLVRPQLATQFRGGSARTLEEEFAVYGLSREAMYLVGGLKLLAATALILGLAYSSLVGPASFLMTILMAGALAMHYRVNDRPIKFVPALLMFLLSLLIRRRLGNGTP